MRKIIVLLLATCSVVILRAQNVQTATNGLYHNPTTGTAVRVVGLGGTLTQNTTIDLGATFTFGLIKGASNYFSVLNNGNVGIGVAAPAQKLDVAGNVNLSGSITAGAAYPNSPAQHIFSYNSSSVYNQKGLKLTETTSGSVVRLHSFNNGLYLTKDDGTAAGLILGSRFNPADNSEFRAGFNRWEIRAGSFSVNQDWAGLGQLELTIGAADRKGVIVKAAGVQTANLQEWQDASGNPLTVVSKNGSVGIGVTNTSDVNYKLFVETGIKTRKVKVTQTAWPDYVFNQQYKLPSLAEVEKFIKANNHLPEVPSAKEIEADGLNLGDNQATLLKKIEELTLYAIDADKKIEQQQQQIELQRKQTEQQQQQITLLQQQTEIIKQLQEEVKKIKSAAAEKK
jgi:hypothetical protein